MKNNLVKFTASFLSLAVLLCSLAACGKKKDKTEEITKKDGVTISAPDTEPAVNFDDYTLPGDDQTNIDIGDLTLESTTDALEISTLPGGNGSGGGSGSGSGSGSGNGSGSSSGLTQSEMISYLRAAGYEYDAEQDIYYTTLDPWQRHFGFVSEYDTAAGYFNMVYVTFKCDFQYDGKYWRIQCWKGQYALLSGAEMGVYTKDINSDLSEDFYACANNDNLLQMGFDFYKTTKDYNDKNRLFTRPLEYHWWQTGFKFGYCNPTNCVAVMTLFAKDTAMANGIEQGLRNIKDKNGKLNPFYKYGTKEASGKGNIYKREGNKFQLIWTTAGYTNYTGNMI